MTTLPTRPLGRTGHQVSNLALGGVCYNLVEDERESAAVVHRALDLGINYIDTAYSYKDSERRIGLVLAERREGVFIATKTIKRDRAGAREEIEESFKRLQTDRIDCLQLHDIHTEKDLAQVLGPGGAMQAVDEFRKTGNIRFVGVTSHVDPDILALALREYPFDTILVSLGAMHAAVRPFHETVVPVARERGTAVLAMKVFASGWFKGMPEKALRYALALPGVAAAVVGVDNLQQLEQNVAVAAASRPLSEEEEEGLLEEAREMYEARKADAWFLTLPPAVGAAV